MGFDLIIKKGPFKIIEITNSDEPYDVEGYSAVYFLTCKNKVSKKGFKLFKETPRLSIDLTQDLDTIWKNMDKGSCRWAIKKAEREGVTVRTSTDFDSFYNLYLEWVNDKDASQDSFSGLPQEKDYMKSGVLFIAELNGELIAGHVYYHDEKLMRLVFAPSKRMRTDIHNANRLIVWEAIKWAKEKGLKFFDLGSIPVPETKYNVGLARYKRGFGGKQITSYNYFRCYSHLLRLWLAIRDLVTEQGTKTKNSMSIRIYGLITKFVKVSKTAPQESIEL